MSRFTIRNAQLVLPDALLFGNIEVHKDIIAEVDADSEMSGGIDFDGDFLLPGFVELHTDNLERHLQPRAGVMWPSAAAALIAHDQQIVGSGITTVLDAVSVGEYSAASARRQMISGTMEAVENPRLRSVLRAEHFLHLRFELADPAALDLYSSLEGSPFIRLVSLMDHTPGQRQWADISTWRKSYPLFAAEDFERIIETRKQNQSIYADANRKEVIARARHRGYILASHDDTTITHVDEAATGGVTISEFPTTLEAAKHARDRGMNVIMGAPNIVRGGSHSGNISALDLARRGLLDGISSDYVPSSLMQAVFTLAKDAGITLPRAVAMASANPAAMLGLHDRGRIDPGRRADFSRVRIVDDLPIVFGVWRAGERVL